MGEDVRPDTTDRHLAAADRAAEANALHRPVVVGPEIVTRPAGPGTPTVHSFLSHLRAQGPTCVPEPLGIEADVETLAFIPGADGGDGWYHQHTDQGLTSAAATATRARGTSSGTTTRRWP